MDDLKRIIAKHLLSHIKPLLENSSQQIVAAIIPGNHYGGVGDEQGEKAFDGCKHRLEEAGIKYFESGRANQSITKFDPEVRIAFGGYENAYNLFIKNFGLDVNGEPLFDPISVYLIHNPVGSGKKGTTGAAVASDADLTIAGHTHEEYTQKVRTMANKFKFTLRAPTLQRPTAQEMVYAGGMPRTSGACMLITTGPEDFSILNLSIMTLRKVGLKAVDEMIENMKKQLQK